MNRFLRAALFASTLLPIGCAAQEESSEGNTAAFSRVGESIVPTTATELRGLNGYHRLLDQKSSVVCVQGDGRDDASRNTYQATGIENTFKATIVASQNDFAKELSVDVGLTVKYGPVDANASFNLLNKFSRSTRSVNVLITDILSYTVDYAGDDVVLKPGFATMMTNDREKFVQQCGDSFINSIKFQAELHTLIVFETESEQQSKDIKAGLNASLSTAKVNATADVKTHMNTVKSQKGVKASVVMWSAGLGSESGIIDVGNPDDPNFMSNLFSKIQVVHRDMASSIAADQARDGSSPGYAKNGANGSPGQRSARAAWLKTKTYDVAEGSPRFDDPVYGAIQKNLTNAENFVRALRGFEQQMRNAHTYEIAPFLSATADQRKQYNVVAPGKHASTVAELEKLAKEWDAKLSPTDANGQGGTYAVAARTAILRCWDAARRGDYRECNWSGTQLDQLPVYNELKSYVTEYLNKGRILPLVYVDKGVDSPEDVEGVCKGIKMRRPTSNEAWRLAISVDEDSQRRIWFADGGSENCKGNTSGKPWGYVDPTLSPPDARCHNDVTYNPVGDRYRAMCVPNDGVFGVLPQL